MASQGPNGPGTIADDAAVGTKTWASPSNAGASDNSYTTANQIGSGSPITHYLKCTNFGFSIPSGATINGVTVEIERKPSQNSISNNVKDSTISLVKGGTVSGANKADTATRWSTTETFYTYGSSSDLWSLSLTDSDVNASNFGVVISVTITSIKPNVIAYIDFVRITITYTAGGGGGSQTSAVAFAND